VGSILGTFIARVKRRFGRDMSETDPAPLEGRRRWKRALLLVPLLTGLLFISVVELGHPAAGNVRKAGIIAALADPLSLFAARSPGERGAGALLSTKPGLGPAERVLSEVRDRDPAAGDAPPAADPLTPADVAALSDGIPGAGGLPGGTGGAGGAPAFASPFFAPFAPGGGDPGDPGLVGSPPPGGPPGIIPPPPGGGISAVPEPATWAMMILGFFGAGAALRRRTRNKAIASCAR
jgi:hypothetical protein